MVVQSGAPHFFASFLNWTNLLYVFIGFVSMYPRNRSISSSDVSSSSNLNIYLAVLKSCASPSLSDSYLIRIFSPVLITFKGWHDVLSIIPAFSYAWLLKIISQTLAGLLPTKQLSIDLGPDQHAINDVIQTSAYFTFAPPNIIFHKNFRLYIIFAIA